MADRILISAGRRRNPAPGAEFEQISGHPRTAARDRNLHTYWLSAGVRCQVMDDAKTIKLIQSAGHRFGRNEWFFTEFCLLSADRPPPTCSFFVRFNRSAATTIETKLRAVLTTHFCVSRFKGYLSKYVRFCSVPTLSEHGNSSVRLNYIAVSYCPPASTRPTLNCRFLGNVSD